MAIATQLRISLLGQVSIVGNGRTIRAARFGGRQNRLLFALLVAEHGRPLPRDELAEAIWEAEPPAGWEKALTVVASRVRALLGEIGVEGASLTSAHGCYRLELPEDTWVDVLVATRSLEDAEAALQSDDVQTALECAARVSSLVRLPLLAGESGMWVEAKRREMAEVYVRALDVLGEGWLRRGNPGEAARWAGQAVELEPFRESGYRRLMEAHIAAGNRAEAFRVYERCRRQLVEELGAFPSPETEALYRRLLADAPTPSGPAAPPAEGVAWRGVGEVGSRRRKIIAVVGFLAVSVTAAAVVIVSRNGGPPAVVPNSLIRIDPHTLRVTQVVPVDDQPDLVIRAGGFVWVTSHILRDIGSGAPRNAGDRTLTRVDPTTGKTVVVGGGLAPCGLTADPSGGVWVANCYPGAGASHDNVVRVDARTLRFSKPWPVPGGEGFIRALAYGGRSLWIGQLAGGDRPNANSVTRLNPRTGSERTIRLVRPADGLSWSEKNADLWIENFDYGTLTRLHASTGATATVQTPLANPSWSLVHGNTVWAADWAGAVVAYLRAVGAPHTRKVVLPVHVGGGVWGLAYGARAIWTTTAHDGTLWRINPKTSKVTRISIPYLPTGITADANDVWVTVRGP